MRHLIPSLCLALLLAETACSAPQAAKRSDADARSKKAAVTRQHAASAYDELDNDTAPVIKKSTATTSTATPTAPPNGDLNKDGIIDVTDVDIMIDMVLGKKEKDLSIADLDGNGMIDVTDVGLLIDIVLGK